MQNLAGKRVAILATHGFEFSELDVPKRKLSEAGAEVVIVSPESGELRGWSGDNWGGSVDVDLALGEAAVEDFDALVLPGGQINPDLLRLNETAIRLVRDFFDAKKPLAAICHAPWLLIEAEVLRGRNATSYPSVRKDVENAGAIWHDESVVCDQVLITSRNPEDLDAFCEMIAEKIAEGVNRDREVA